MNEHELGFTFFLAEPGRRRMRTLLELGAKRRAEVRALLNHALKLDLRYACHLEGGDGFARSAEAALRAHGAPDICHVMSGDEALDGREMPLAAALDAVAGSFSGAFISSIPGGSAISNMRR